AAVAERATDPAARPALDSITTALDPERADESAARAAARALRALLPHVRTPDDSTWAQIRLTEAHALSDDQAGACRALRAAKGSARTGPQREAVRKYEGTLGC
ncbi:hypothetical protein, partial [Roseisolibacter sp. H3M3-2]|uniref:hypothetical protein n=1 Tax=Roseisolibacter sp. H3M3-2 TaxID=3031323 RepID=UPI0023DC3890